MFFRGGWFIFSSDPRRNSYPFRCESLGAGTRDTANTRQNIGGRGTSLDRIGKKFWVVSPLDKGLFRCYFPCSWHQSALVVGSLSSSCCLCRLHIRDHLIPSFCPWLVVSALLPLSFHAWPLPLSPCVTLTNRGGRRLARRARRPRPLLGVELAVLIVSHCQSKVGLLRRERSCGELGRDEQQRAKQ